MANLSAGHQNSGTDNPAKEDVKCKRYYLSLMGKFPEGTTTYLVVLPEDSAGEIYILFEVSLNPAFNANLPNKRS